LCGARMASSCRLDVHNFNKSLSHIHKCEVTIEKRIFLRMPNKFHSTEWSTD
jgi:hypothetical protein